MICEFAFSSFDETKKREKAVYMFVLLIVSAFKIKMRFCCLDQCFFHQFFSIIFICGKNEEKRRKKFDNLRKSVF